MFKFYSEAYTTINMTYLRSGIAAWELLNTQK